MKFKLIICIITAAISMQVICAQTIEVSGQVTDETGQPLLGANVIIKGTSKGTVTDFDGNYSIKVGPNDRLTFTYIGFIAKEYSVDGKSVIDVSLLPEAQSLDEVVVIGYGTQKKSNIVGAVSDVSGKDLVSTGITNLSQVIQDRLPGVFTQINTGQPGADDAKITVRGVSSFNGDNSPLILVDGVEAAGGFSQLDPGEISSISVLKDASSTAIYGVRGADGVILITTKRGSIGAPKISVAGGITAKVLTDIPDQLGSYDVLTLGQESIKNSGFYDGLRSQRYIDTFLDPNRDPYAYPDIDWYDALIRDVGWESNARINVSGGTDFVKYFTSFSVNHVGDIVKTEKSNGYYSPEFSYDKYNFRTNLDFNLTKTTTLKTDISGRSELRKTPNTEVAADQFSNVFKFIDQATPYLFPLYYPEEFVASHPDPLAPNQSGIRLAGAGAEVPYQFNAYNALNYSGMRKFRRDVVDIQIGLTQKLDFITKGLLLSGRFNYSTAYEYEKREGWNVSEWLYDTERDQWREQSGQNYNSSDLDFHSTGGENYKSSIRNIYYEAKLDYHRQFGSHNVGFVGVFNRNERRLSATDLPYFGEDWVGRANYDYKQRYIFEVSAGYNGSEKFAPGKRFGFFPAAAIGWNIAKEPLVEKNLPWLDDFKVRYSYGETGNQKNSPRFLYLGGWDQVSSKWGYMRFGLPAANEAPRYGEVKIANPNATWETAYKQNLGFDVALLSNDLTLAVDLYKERREGILLSNPVPSYYHPGFGSLGKVGLPPINQGKSKNQGIEVVSNYSHLTPSGFRYSLGGNFTIADSRIVYRADRALTPDYQKQQGKPIGWISGYQTNGYINNFEQAVNAPAISGGNAPGNYFYSDFNGDGEIEANDNVPMEETNQPFILYAFNTNLSYKGIDLGVRFFGKDGVAYSTNKYYPNFDQHLLEAKTVHLDRWSPENQDAQFPAFSNAGERFYRKRSDANVLSTAYLKLQNVTLGYTLESAYLQRLLRIQRMKFNLSGQNLYTWSDVPFGDPEGGNGLSGGYGAYPLVKRYIFTLNIDF
ncbi:SusC/RagA family TonB-linked outer membrane protein [Zobellia uliginosa]|uniref:SusC/RagA family TonB-linked outer membrane protein n=1 Tax=Zobellia uliginosa TaxID=143224 RepID=UPI0026E40C62|nr:TonB-dependent receptor [Zobellia uliginosa]MDO6519463.1 TonB-dependent receptor [Zobellia uliginosa]